MQSPISGDLALDFSSREMARNYEFCGVWQDSLDTVFADVAPYYDIASNFASLGLCARWRRRFVSAIDVEPGDRVLDVCAGTNGVGIELLRRQPDLEMVAMDRSAAMQAVGQRLARDQGFEIESVIGDVHRLPFPTASFDVVTLQWASRHLRVVEVFSEIRRVLKPGGRFYHCDMLRPENRLMEALYSAYLKACLSTTALAFGSCAEAWACRDYFVRAIKLFYSSRELTGLLQSLGFTDVVSRNAVGGTMAYHRATNA